MLVRCSRVQLETQKAPARQRRLGDRRPALAGIRQWESLARGRRQQGGGRQHQPPAAHPQLARTRNRRRFAHTSPPPCAILEAGFGSSGCRSLSDRSIVGLEAGRHQAGDLRPIRFTSYVLLNFTPHLKEQEEINEAKGHSGKLALKGLEFLCQSFARAHFALYLRYKAFQR